MKREELLETFSRLSGANAEKLSCLDEVGKFLHLFLKAELKEASVKGDGATYRALRESIISELSSLYVHSVGGRRKDLEVAMDVNSFFRLVPAAKVDGVVRESLRLDEVLELCSQTLKKQGGCSEERGWQRVAAPGSKLIDESAGKIARQVVDELIAGGCRGADNVKARVKKLKELTLEAAKDELSAEEKVHLKVASEHAAGEQAAKKKKRLETEAEKLGLEFEKPLDAKRIVEAMAADQQLAEAVILGLIEAKGDDYVDTIVSHAADARA